MLSHTRDWLTNPGARYPPGPVLEQLTAPAPGVRHALQRASILTEQLNDEVLDLALEPLRVLYPQTHIPAAGTSNPLGGLGLQRRVEATHPGGVVEQWLTLRNLSAAQCHWYLHQLLFLPWAAPEHRRQNLYHTHPERRGAQSFPRPVLPALSPGQGPAALQQGPPLDTATTVQQRGSNGADGAEPDCTNCGAVAWTAASRHLARDTTGLRQYRPADRTALASAVAAVTMGPVAAWPAQLLPHGGGLTLINVHGPQAGCSPWAGRAAFWANIQMYATACSLGGRHPVVIAGDTNVYIDATSNPATEHFRVGWEACGFRRATAGGEEDMTPTLHPSRHRVDTFLVNEPLLPWSLRESVWACVMAPPQVICSDHLQVRLALPGLLNAAGRAAMPTPYSHTEGRLLPYDAEAAPVQHCLWAAVTAAQDEPSLAPWLGPAEQHAYGSMPAAAVDKVFEHLHAAHDALARVVGRRQPSPAGTDPAEGDPLESGKRLQAAVLRYDTLAACAPAAYQADAARHGILSSAALRLAEGLRGASPGFRSTTEPTTGGAGEASSRPRRGHPPTPRTPGGRPQARHQGLLAPPRP